MYNIWYIIYNISYMYVIWYIYIYIFGLLTMPTSWMWIHTGRNLLFIILHFLPRAQHGLSKYLLNEVVSGVGIFSREEIRKVTNLNMFVGGMVGNWRNSTGNSKMYPTTYSLGVRGYKTKLSFFFYVLGLSIPVTVSQ